MSEWGGVRGEWGVRSLVQETLFTLYVFPVLQWISRAWITVIVMEWSRWPLCGLIVHTTLASQRMGEIGLFIAATKGCCRWACRAVLRYAL